MRDKYCTSNTRTPASGITQCFRETITREREREKGKGTNQIYKSKELLEGKNNLFFNNFNNYLSSPIEFQDFGCPASNDHKSMSKNY